MTDLGNELCFFQLNLVTGDEKGSLSFFILKFYGNIPLKIHQRSLVRQNVEKQTLFLEDIVNLGMNSYSPGINKYAISIHTKLRRIL